MKFIHLSDLHLGKRVNEFPMLEDQRYILERIIDIIDEEKPQAVLIAGDVYDKPVPSGEAVQLFDDFISKLAERELEVMIISGNHDSAERLSFGARIMSRRGIHLAGGYDGTTHKVTLEDEYGEVDFYLLPFLKPVHVRAVIARELVENGKVAGVGSNVSADAGLGTLNGSSKESDRKNNAGTEAVTVTAADAGAGTVNGSSTISGRENDAGIEAVAAADAGVGTSDGTDEGSDAVVNAETTTETALGTGHGTDAVPVIGTYTDAVRYAIKRMDIDYDKRNVLIAHQFCTGSMRSESEEISVGGLDNVDAEVFEGIDYTALGHLHGPQNTASERVRYCGSPLKYSFSEANQNKSVTIVEMGEKANGVSEISIKTRELIPMRDMRELRGKFCDLTNNNYLNNIGRMINIEDIASNTNEAINTEEAASNTNVENNTNDKNNRNDFKGFSTDDYIRIVLTDEEDVIGALASLRAIYPNIMRLEYDNTRTRAASIAPDLEDTDSRTPLEIFAGLYESQNGKPMDEDQVKLISELIERVWSAD